MRQRVVGTVALLVTLCGSASSGAGQPTVGATPQEPIDQAMNARIRAEGLERSQVEHTFHTLTDVIGPRLAGSTGYDAAAAWAQSRFTAWGLANARLEPFAFGRGWALEKLSLEMTAPRYMPLSGYPEAWAPSIPGVLTGAPIYIAELDSAGIAALGDRLRGAIVLPYLPQDQFRQDRPQPAAGDSVRTGNPAVPALRSTTPIGRVNTLLLRAGAALVLRPGSGEHGTVFVEGNRALPDTALPVIALATEHYNMLARMLDGGTPVELRVELRTRYEPNSEDANVIAEIPGTDPQLRDEIVLISAHLDSWHSSTGATDNADGVASVMEAMRILSAIGARPRRTIQVALWGAEENGFGGSTGYRNRHLPDQAARDRISVMLNDDPGTGATWGFYMEQNPAAKAIFDAWLEPFRDLGAQRNVIDGIGSTDHTVFNAIGIPGFTAIKDFAGYDSRARHGNADFFERTNIERLKQSAVVMASFAWHAAQRAERIPRRGTGQPASSAGPGAPIPDAAQPGCRQSAPSPAVVILVDGRRVTAEEFCAIEPSRIDAIEIRLLADALMERYGIPAPMGAILVYLAPGPDAAKKAALDAITILQNEYFSRNGRFAGDLVELGWRDGTGQIDVQLTVGDGGLSWSAHAIHRAFVRDEGRATASGSRVADTP